MKSTQTGEEEVKSQATRSIYVDYLIESTKQPLKPASEFSETAVKPSDSCCPSCHFVCNLTMDLKPGASK